MELNEFVQKTISEIVSAVNTSGEKSGKRINLISNYSTGGKDIEFDISVAVEEKGVNEGGGKIKVLSLLEIGGKKTSEVTNSVVNRIKFGVSVSEKVIP